MSQLNEKIIVLANQKGGVGKSTLAIHLAHAWARQGQAVTVHDLDDNRSALKYQASLSGMLWRGQEDAIFADPERCTIIDTPPTLGEGLRVALQSAHVAIVPINNWDAAEGLARLLDSFQRAKATNPGLKYWLAGMMVGANTVHWQESRAQLAGRFGPLICDAEVPRATVFERASTEKQTLFDYDPRHTALVDVCALAEELKQKILS